MKAMHMSLPKQWQDYLEPHWLVSRSDEMKFSSIASKCVISLLKYAPILSLPAQGLCGNTGMHSYMSLHLAVKSWSLQNSSANDFVFSWGAHSYFGKACLAGLSGLQCLASRQLCLGALQETSNLVFRLALLELSLLHHYVQNHLQRD